VTELTVKHEPVSGGAVIEIRGADISETRFRLRDPYTEKFLTKRGWTKSASFLPGEAMTADGVTTIALDAELARKITPGLKLSLEQPATGFQEILGWPPASPVTPVAAAIADEPPAAEDVADETSGVDTEVEDIPEPKEPEAAPLLLDSFEPTIMHDRVHEEEKASAEPQPVFITESDSPPSIWKPAAIAAVIFLLLGTGLGYALSGSGGGGAIKQAQQAAAMQLEKQKFEFDRQLKEARQQASNASSDTAKASEQLTADRDAARKALADKEKSVAALQKQLDDANAQIDAVKNAAGDEAKAQIGALDQKVASLNGELDKANDQIAADKQTARQEAEALNEDMNKQTSALTAQLEQAKQQLTAREAELKDAQTKLEDANAELGAARDAAKSQAATANTALSEKINSLTAEVKRNQQQLAERDAALRDAQAKLSVANIQVDALKVVAGKTTEAGLEKTAMSEKVAQLTAELDKTSQNLSDREQALTDATARLRDTEAKLAAAGKRNDELAAKASQQQGQTQTELASGENTNRLQEERDLYANELKTMTGNFSALQAEKTKLEKALSDLQSQNKQASLTISKTASKAIWGATAIDQNGAIYSLQNQAGEKLAQDNVAAMCRGKSGARCETLATYNNACFSVARVEGEGPTADNYAYFVHRDWKTAARTALERCESMGTSCTTRFTACSPEALSKPISN
jgi:predicted  nucleic acid-binding Zn-ribbon protein